MSQGGGVARFGTAAQDREEAPEPEKRRRRERGGGEVAHGSGVGRRGLTGRGAVKGKIAV